MKIKWPFNALRAKKKKPVLAALPGQSAVVKGRLEPGSMTWAFMDNWAKEQLQEARIDNDSFSRDQLQTAKIRGRIELLKEIIDLPKIKTADFEDFEPYTEAVEKATYAGY